jgi:hypothetical protein
MMCRIGQCHEPPGRQSHLSCHVENSNWEGTFGMAGLLLNMSIALTHASRTVKLLGRLQRSACFFLLSPLRCKHIRAVLNANDRDRMLLVNVLGYALS